MQNPLEFLNARIDLARSSRRRTKRVQSIASDERREREDLGILAMADDRALDTSASTETAVQPPSAVSKLVIVVTFCVAIFYAEDIASALRGWDSAIFWCVILLFLIASRIGTQIVLRIAASGGELPANDEMFNLPDINLPANEPEVLQNPPSTAESSSSFLSSLRWRRGSASAHG